MTEIHRIFAALDGQHIPGGCDHCDAEQVPSIDSDGVLHLTVQHDDSCPYWKQINS